MARSSTYGTLFGGNGALDWRPKYWRNDGSRTAIIYCHSLDGNELQDLTDPSMSKFIGAMVDEGYPVLSGWFAGNGWGNATVLSQVDAAWTYVKSTLGARVDKVGFVGQSMGHLAAMNWVASHRSETAFVVSSMGVCDLNDLWANSAYTASVNAAYGGAYSNATHGPTYNPTVNAATKYSGLNWFGWVGASDTTAKPAKAQALKDAIGSTATLNTVPGDHGGATIGSWDIPATLDFIRSVAPQ